MKRSIKHLRKHTQEELNILVDLIKHYVRNCEMIILYGSYARGNYVIWDEYIERGIRYSYQSDYDIMIVVSKGSKTTTEKSLEYKITPKYEKHFAESKRITPPQFIVEDINRLNKEIELNQYFFTDIAKEGIMLYNSNKYSLAKPRNLSFEEIKEIAVNEFKIYYPDGEDFLFDGYSYYQRENYRLGAFLLHQSCERFYCAICLVFTNYRPKCHKLDRLIMITKELSREIVNTFPMNNDFEKRCFDLLCRAYIEARYNINFKVTKEEYEYMLTRVEVLKDITKRICSEKIDSYDTFIQPNKETKSGDLK